MIRKVQKERSAAKSLYINEFQKLKYEVNILWAAHQVHHSSEDYNLFTALRQSVLQKYTSWMFNLPMAFFIPPSVFAVHLQFNLLYQFWIHTEVITKLGPLEWILNTPSHHRVHHGRNPYCIDKNYGGTLIIWDRIFGTFEAEDAKVVYGLTHPVNSFDPIMLQLRPLAHIWNTFWATPGFSNKLSVIFKGPGWGPGKPRLGLPEEIPEITGKEVPFNPHVPAYLNCYALVHFAVIVDLYTELLASVTLESHGNADAWDKLASLGTLERQKSLKPCSSLKLGTHLLMYNMYCGILPEDKSKAGTLEIIRCLVFIGVYKLGYFRSQFSFLGYAYEAYFLEDERENVRGEKNALVVSLQQNAKGGKEGVFLNVAVCLSYFGNVAGKMDFLLKYFEFGFAYQKYSNRGDKWEIRWEQKEKKENGTSICSITLSGDWREEALKSVAVKSKRGRCSAGPSSFAAGLVAGCRNPMTDHVSPGLSLPLSSTSLHYSVPDVLQMASIIIYTRKMKVFLYSTAHCLDPVLEEKMPADEDLLQIQETPQMFTTPFSGFLLHGLPSFFILNAQQQLESIRRAARRHLPVVGLSLLAMKNSVSYALLKAVSSKLRGLVYILSEPGFCPLTGYSQRKQVKKEKDEDHVCKNACKSSLNLNVGQAYSFSDYKIQTLKHIFKGGNILKLGEREDEIKRKCIPPRRYASFFLLFLFFPKQSLKSVSEILTLSTADRRVEAISALSRAVSCGGQWEATVGSPPAAPEAAFSPGVLTQNLTRGFQADFAERPSRDVATANKNENKLLVFLDKIFVCFLITVGTKLVSKSSFSHLEKITPYRKTSVASIGSTHFFPSAKTLDTLGSSFGTASQKCYNMKSAGGKKDIMSRHLRYTKTLQKRKWQKTTLVFSNKEKKFTSVTNNNCLNFAIFRVREIFLCEGQRFLSENFKYKISHINRTKKTNKNKKQRKKPQPHKMFLILIGDVRGDARLVFQKLLERRSHMFCFQGLAIVLLESKVQERNSILPLSTDQECLRTAPEGLNRLVNLTMSCGLNNHMGSSEIRFVGLRTLLKPLPKGYFKAFCSQMHVSFQEFMQCDKLHGTKEKHFHFNIKANGKLGSVLCLFCPTYGKQQKNVETLSKTELLSVLVFMCKKKYFEGRQGSLDGLEQQNLQSKKGAQNEQKFSSGEQALQSLLSAEQCFEGATTTPPTPSFVSSILEDDGMGRKWALNPCIYVLHLASWELTVLSRFMPARSIWKPPDKISDDLHELIPFRALILRGRKERAEPCETDAATRACSCVNIIKRVCVWETAGLQKKREGTFQNFVGSSSPVPVCPKAMTTLSALQQGKAFLAVPKILSHAALMEFPSKLRKHALRDLQIEACGSSGYPEGGKSLCFILQKENIFIEADASQISQEPKTFPESVASLHRETCFITSEQGEEQLLICKDTKLAATQQNGCIIKDQVLTPFVFPRKHEWEIVPTILIQGKKKDMNMRMLKKDRSERFREEVFGLIQFTSEGTKILNHLLETGDNNKSRVSVGLDGKNLLCSMIIESSDLKQEKEHIRRVQANKHHKYFGHVVNRMLELEKSSYHSQRRAERLMKTKCMMTVENGHEEKKLTENIYYQCILISFRRLQQNMTITKTQKMSSSFIIKNSLTFMNLQLPLNTFMSLLLLKEDKSSLVKCIGRKRKKNNLKSKQFQQGRHAEDLSIKVSVKAQGTYVVRLLTTTIINAVTFELKNSAKINYLMRLEKEVNTKYTQESTLASDQGIPQQVTSELFKTDRVYFLIVYLCDLYCLTDFNVCVFPHQREDDLLLLIIKGCSSCCDCCTGVALGRLNRASSKQTFAKEPTKLALASGSQNTETDDPLALCFKDFNLPADTIYFILDVNFSFFGDEQYILKREKHLLRLLGVNRCFMPSITSLRAFSLKETLHWLFVNCSPYSFVEELKLDPVLIHSRREQEVPEQVLEESGRPGQRSAERGSRRCLGRMEAGEPGTAGCC
ncbi:hypothetical protein IHE44_0000300 [Lamprotornis superbus]|uniref:Alkylglycerol monooxygenase n=1 Tax=Lamprotornis superbus TaxID=245042 RepID=A0A835NZB3_9PASS|nr:hypothetical protein IHE44_0000300 [Lamprotornis superbus]